MKKGLSPNPTPKTFNDFSVSGDKPLIQKNVKGSEQDLKKDYFKRVLPITPQAYDNKFRLSSQ